MIINWFGQSCFKIQGEKSVIITDPLSKDSDLKVSRLTADVVTVSDSNSKEIDAKAVKGISTPEPFIVSQPGEYEVKSTFIYAINSNGDDPNEKKGGNIIYRLEIDLVTIAHLGSLNHPLTNGELERLEGIDILMVPVGGGDFLNAKQAAALISQLEPRMVIPMNYKIKGLKANLDSLDKFCKEIGICPTEEVSKFRVAKKDLPQEEMKVVVFQP